MSKMMTFLCAGAFSAMFGVAGCSAVDDGTETYDETELAAKPGAHFVGTPTCTQVGDVLTCSGSVAGLGNRAVTVNLEVGAGCTNRGGNNPPGQLSTTSDPIQPEHGRINFGVSADADCPGPMTAFFISPATITIFQNGTEVFTGTIPF